MQVLKRVRKLCLALPGATEKEAWGAPTFRAGRIFAMFSDHHHGVDWIALWVIAPPGMQSELVDADPERFFVPPYVGKQGWVGVRLDRETNWDQVHDLVEDGYRMIAPKKLLAELDQS